MSDDIAIKIENLSKRYRYGGAAPLSANLRSDITEWAKGLLRKQDPRPQTVDSRPSESPKSDVCGLKSDVSHRPTLHEIHEDRLSHDPNYFWALRDINLEVRQGEVVGIIGRNGAGKSTLLKILSRITPPTTGKITYNGRIASLLEVGTGFHRELTGRENIYLNGSILGMKRAEIAKKFDEIVAFAEVEKFIDTPVKFYSSGMYVRLAFAVAANLEPEILVVDEVLAVGDASFQKKCLGKMGDVARQGRTILFVSHNMAAVRSLCSRACLLVDGQVAAEGTPEQCISHYLLANGGALPTEINTDNHHRYAQIGDHDGLLLHITHVKLIVGTTQAILSQGSPLIVEMEFNVRTTLHDVLLGVAVHSSDSPLIWESRSVESYRPIDQLAPGNYVIRCELTNNPLNVGLYTLHVGSRCASRGLDHIVDVLTFQVEHATPMGSIWFDQLSGFVRIPAKWTKPEPIR